MAKEEVRSSMELNEMNYIKKKSNPEWVDYDYYSYYYWGEKQRPKGKN